VNFAIRTPEGVFVKLMKQPCGSCDAETVVAEETAAEGVYWDYDRSMPAGPNAMLLTLKGEADTYVLEVESAEVGVLIRNMRLPDVAPVMSEFLAGADPEVVGAVVGHIVAHLARAARTPPG
jgi:hypothetical protein